MAMCRNDPIRDEMSLWQSGATSAYDRLLIPWGACRFGFFPWTSMEVSPSGGVPARAWTLSRHSG